MTGRSYLARRLAFALLVVFGVTVTTFLLMHAVPGGPWSNDRAVSAGVQGKLDAIGKEHPEHAAFATQMRVLIDRFDLDQYMATLKALHSHEH